MRKGARKELLLLLKKCVMYGIINSPINKNLTDEYYEQFNLSENDI